MVMPARETLAAVPDADQNPDAPAGTPDAVAGAEAPPVPPPPSGPGGAPTREEIRQRARTALANGDMSIEEIVCDMYASQYYFEVQITQLVMFLDSFTASGIGKRLFKKTGRQAAQAAAEFEAEQHQQ